MAFKPYSGVTKQQKQKKNNNKKERAKTNKQASKKTKIKTKNKTEKAHTQNNNTQLAMYTKKSIYFKFYNVTISFVQISNFTLSHRAV